MGRRKLVRPGSHAGNANELMKVARAALQDGRKDEAVEVLRRAALVARDAATKASVGRALEALGLVPEAAQCLAAASALNPSDALVVFDLGRMYLYQQRYNEALDPLQRFVAANPSNAIGLHNLALCLQNLGRTQEALEAFRQSAACAGPADPLAPMHHARGLCLHIAGDRSGSEEAFRAALTVEPSSLASRLALGASFRETRRFEEAIQLYLEGIAVSPAQPLYEQALGETYQAQGRHQEALDHYDRALALEPRNAFCLLMTYDLLQVYLCRPEEALQRLKQVLAVDPSNVDAWLRMASTFAASRRHEDARLCCMKALEAAPGCPAVLSFLIFVSDHDASVSPQSRKELRAEYQRLVGEPAAALQRPHENPPQARRRLRVGYVSGDFYQHSAGLISLAALREHDREQFEVFCYYNNKFEDALTAEIRAASHHFFPILHLSDDEVADLVRSHGIDILVDLGGHIDGNRLPVFARKPAPVQISAWGYVSGTGLAAMDYLLVDDVLVSPEMEDQFTEKMLRLSAPLTAIPPDDALPPSDLPLLRNGYPTFGCLNRFNKLSNLTLQLWASLMRAVPDARLILKDRAFDSPSLRDDVLKLFEEQKVSPERIVLLGGTGREEHLLTYNEIDLALDPFPAGGGFTTLEALWMGVPSVTCLTGSILGRIAASLQHNVGLDAFVASSYEEYVLKAWRAFDEPEHLQALRRGLRERVRQATCCNPPAYTRELEAAYRRVWAEWCARQAVSGLKIGARR